MKHLLGPWLRQSTYSTLLQLKSSTYLTGPLLHLPPVERDFTISKEKASEQEWEKAYTNGLLSNFTTHSFAMKRIPALEKLGTDYLEILNDKGEFQRAFVTMENPQKKGEYRLFEVTYQYFDDDKKDGKLVTDSTGFKMCAAVEHVLPNHSKDDANKIITALKILPEQPRNLVKDENGKVVQTWALGGWTQEVGGGYNAWEIEHGRYPLQWKNLLGVDGKPRAIDEALAAMKKIGVELEAKGDKPGSTIEVTGQSMGTPNAQMVKFMLEEYYKQKDVSCMNIVPMAYGQTLKQLTELKYNREAGNKDFVHLKDLKTPDEQAKAEQIAVSINDTKNKQTIYSSNNYFAHYNVDGNAILNSAPGLLGDKVLLVNPDPINQSLTAPDRDGFLDHGFRIKSDHLLPAFNDKTTQGPKVLTPAIYNPNHSVHDALFKDLHQDKGLVENMLIESLHNFNRTKNKFVYGNQSSGREPLTEAKLYETAANYTPVAPQPEIKPELNPKEIANLKSPDQVVNR